MADFKRMALGGPLPIGGSGSSWGTNAFTIDATTDKVVWVWQAPEAITITKLGFLYGTRTGTPVQHKIGLQGLDGSAPAINDGTYLGGGTPASGTFTPPADATWNSTWRWITLDNSYTCARGDRMTIVIEPVGTPDGSNNGSFVYEGSQVGWVAGFPYGNTINAGTPTVRTGLPIFGLQSASLTYGHPVLAVYIPQIGLNSTPDEIALRFSLSSSFVSTYKVVGCRFSHRCANSGNNVIMSLYDGTTALQTVTWPTNHNSGQSSSARTAEWFFDEDTLSTLTGGSTYRLAFAPQANNINFGMWGYTSNAAAELSAWPGGTDFFLSTRTDGGAWVDDQTTRPVAEIIIDDWVAPSGGGSVFIINE